MCQKNKKKKQTTYLEIVWDSVAALTTKTNYKVGIKYKQKVI